MINPSDVYEKLVKSGNEWAEANGAADMLEEAKKPILSQLMLKFEGSVAFKEMQAMSSNEYK